MLFTFLAAVAAIQSSAGRTEDPSSKILGLASITDLDGSIGSNPTDTLQMAQGIVDSIMLETGNATEHLSDEDQALLKSVIDLVRNSMYKSMDQSHDTDKEALARAIRDAEECNLVINARQSPDGDLGRLHQGAKELQIELNRLQGIVDEKTEANETAWGDFRAHMTLISDAPECPEFPERTMALLDVYFESSAYVYWFSQVRDPYFSQRDLYLAAHKALQEALNAYAAEKARLDIKFCDWKRELEAACAAFNMCFTTASNYYTNELVPRVQKDMNSRVEAFKAGEVLISQVEFLLAIRESNEPPTDISTDRFELDFPALPAKALCDLTPLLDEMWNPPIDCIFELLDGEGACRTADGGVGEHNTLYGKSEASCKALCRNDATCLAVEFQTSRAWCEIHTAPIAYADHVWWLPGIECWRKIP